MPNYYTVAWEGSVQREFTELWLRSEKDLRNRLTKAGGIIDRQFAENPGRLGKPIPDEESFRVWILPDFDKRVSVVFRLSEADRRVQVVRISVEL